MLDMGATGHLHHAGGVDEVVAVHQLQAAQPRAHHAKDAGQRGCVRVEAVLRVNAGISARNDTCSGVISTSLLSTRGEHSGHVSGIIQLLAQHGSSLTAVNGWHQGSAALSTISVTTPVEVKCLQASYASKPTLRQFT